MDWGLQYSLQKGADGKEHKITSFTTAVSVPDDVYFSVYDIASRLAEDFCQRMELQADLLEFMVQQRPSLLQGNVVRLQSHPHYAVNARIVDAWQRNEPLAPPKRHTPSVTREAKRIYHSDALKKLSSDGIIQLIDTGQQTLHIDGNAQYASTQLAEWIASQNGTSYGEARRKVNNLFSHYHARETHMQEKEFSSVDVDEMPVRIVRGSSALKLIPAEYRNRVTTANIQPPAPKVQKIGKRQQVLEELVHEGKILAYEAPAEGPGILEPEAFYWLTSISRWVEERTGAPITNRATTRFSKCRDAERNAGISNEEGNYRNMQGLIIVKGSEIPKLISPEFRHLVQLRKGNGQKAIVESAPLPERAILENTTQTEHRSKAVMVSTPERTYTKASAINSFGSASPLEAALDETAGFRIAEATAERGRMPAAMPKIVEEARPPAVIVLDDVESGGGVAYLSAKAMHFPKGESCRLRPVIDVLDEMTGDKQYSSRLVQAVARELPNIGKVTGKSRVPTDMLYDIVKRKIALPVELKDRVTLSPKVEAQDGWISFQEARRQAFKAGIAEHTFDTWTRLQRSEHDGKAIRGQGAEMLINEELFLEYVTAP